MTDIKENIFFALAKIKSTLGDKYFQKTHKEFEAAFLRTGDSKSKDCLDIGRKILKDFADKIIPLSKDRE
jgi:hypothetical protein